MRTIVAASLVGLGGAKMQCPGSSANALLPHAGMKLTSTANEPCGAVKAEIQARIAGKNGWYDQHNRGTYAEANFGGDVSATRTTGNGKFTDKMIFTLTEQRSGNCLIEACSESQVTSVFDNGANYCELKLLFCGSDEGCNVAHSDFTNSGEKTHAMAKASTGVAACLKVEDEVNLEEEEDRGRPLQRRERPTYSKGFVRQARNAIVPVAIIDESMRSGAPASWDWTQHGATSAVKDQKACGSCWAFSATEGVESGVFMVTGSLPPNLATQQVVACDKTSGGCRGGDLPTAFAYIQGDGGIDSDADYPDTSHKYGITGRCKKHQHVAQITAYKYAVPPCQGGSCSSQDEDGLMAALHNFGPLSVCVNANTFNDYSSGIGINGEACSGAYNTLDHCVQLVGYDSTGDSPYWKVKNSWNTAWGEDGFIRLPMGSNYCGIADEAMYVQAHLVSSDVAV